MESRERPLELRHDDRPAAADRLLRAAQHMKVAALGIDLHEAEVLERQGVDRPGADGGREPVLAGQEGQRRRVADAVVIRPAVMHRDRDLLVLGAAERERDILVVQGGVGRDHIVAVIEQEVGAQHPEYLDLRLECMDRAEEPAHENRVEAEIGARIDGAALHGPRAFDHRFQVCVPEAAIEDRVAHEVRLAEQEAAIGAVVEHERCPADLHGHVGRERLSQRMRRSAGAFRPVVAAPGVSGSIGHRRQQILDARQACPECRLVLVQTVDAALQRGGATPARIRLGRRAAARHGTRIECRDHVLDAGKPMVARRLVLPQGVERKVERGGRNIDLLAVTRWPFADLGDPPAGFSDLRVVRPDDVLEVRTQEPKHGGPDRIRDPAQTCRAMARALQVFELCHECPSESGAGYRRPVRCLPSASLV